MITEHSICRGICDRCGRDFQYDYNEVDSTIAVGKIFPQTHQYKVYILCDNCQRILNAWWKDGEEEKRRQAFADKLKFEVTFDPDGLDEFFGRGEDDGKQT